MVRRRKAIFSEGGIQHTRCVEGTECSRIKNHLHQSWVDPRIGCVRNKRVQAAKNRVGRRISIRRSCRMEHGLGGVVALPWLISEDGWGRHMTDSPKRNIKCQLSQRPRTHTPPAEASAPACIHLLTIPDSTQDPTSLRSPGGRGRQGPCAMPS